MKFDRKPIYLICEKKEKIFKIFLKEYPIAIKQYFEANCKFMVKQKYDKNHNARPE